MSQVLTLKLPDGASLENGKTLEAEINRIAGIKSAGVQQTRGLDAAAIAVWVGIANPAMDVIKKKIEVIRGKGLSGVEIQLPNNGGDCEGRLRLAGRSGETFESRTRSVIVGNRRSRVQ